MGGWPAGPAALSKAATALPAGLSTARAGSGALLGTSAGAGLATNNASVVSVAASSAIVVESRITVWWSSAGGDRPDRARAQWAKSRPPARPTATVRSVSTIPVHTPATAMQRLAYGLDPPETGHSRTCWGQTAVAPVIYGMLTKTVPVARCASGAPVATAPAPPLCWSPRKVAHDRCCGAAERLKTRSGAAPTRTPSTTHQPADLTSRQQNAASRTPDAATYGATSRLLQSPSPAARPQPPNPARRTSRRFYQPHDGMAIQNWQARRQGETPTSRTTGSRRNRPPSLLEPGSMPARAARSKGRSGCRIPAVRTGTCSPRTPH